MSETRFETMRRLTAAAGLDGWLLYDFRGGNPLASQVIGLPADAHLTRRWFLYVPKSGNPTLLANGIETGNWRTMLAAIPGGDTVRVRPFANHSDLRAALGEILKSGAQVAMEYSPNASVPFVSRVDAGTLEQIRSFGVEIVTSGDLLQHFLVLSDEELAAHKEAAEVLMAAKDAGFRLVHDCLQTGEPVDELSVQAAVLQVIEEGGLITDHPPIVGFGAHAGDPHYAPNEKENATLKPGQCVLIDLWGQKPGMPYADITWMGCAGQPSSELIDAWTAVRDARDAAVEFIEQRGYSSLQGWQVDRVARDHLTQFGYGDVFIHRLGHNIHLTDHGPGVNLDDFETHDTRQLLTGLLCSIEPGAYMPARDIGIRTEIDIYFAPGGDLEVTTRSQRELLILGESGVAYEDLINNA